MKKICTASIVTIAVLACLLLCTPALADYDFDGFPVVTRTNGTVNGGVFIGSVGWTGEYAPLSASFNVPDGTVKWARLYTGIWGGNPTNTGWVNVTFNEIYDENGLGPIHLQGEDDTNPNVWCSGNGKYWMWYNVTNLTNAGQINTAKTSKVNGSIDGRIYGIVLVVVYEGGDNPKNIQYWINDGSDAVHYAYGPHPEKNVGTTYFNGTVEIANVTKANLTMVHLTGYSPPCSNCLKFNGHELNTSMVDSNTFELNSWDVSGYVNASGNNVWYSRGKDEYVNVANTILVVERESAEKPDLLITAINAYHYGTSCSPWFNLVNEVDVTVKNTGDTDAESFYVNLSARVKDEEEYEIIGKQEVPGLEAGSSTELQFEWTPIGDDCLEDCTFTDTSKEYELKAVADCDCAINESDETNNNFIPEEVTVVGYNGYTGDEPLENVAHGTLNGCLIFTTGDGEYGGLYSPGDSIDTTYEITIPAGASVVLARLNVYYTWHYEKDSCPAMEVSIDGTVVELDASYNDIKCQCPGAAWEFPWGNYVYDITDYIQGSDTYTVTVTRLVFPPNPSFCIAAPGIVLVYADTNAPVIEYWINEGADILIGGRRGDGGYLSLEECINNATFPASSETREVTNATLGVVSPWAGCAWVPGTTAYLYFNGIELGRGVYHGYCSPYNKIIDGISMHVGSTYAQVGVNVTDVTSYYLKARDNWVGQGDDGDCMMPTNAFLVISYKEEKEESFDTGSPANPYPSIFGTHNGTLTPKYYITVSKMYTYPCPGTGGHSEYIEIWNTTGWSVNASWTGYKADWHNISFGEPFTLEADKSYNYTIRTGSYPQIIHAKEFNATGGKITCVEFIDVNGKRYNNWIPAIKLFL